MSNPHSLQHRASLPTVGSEGCGQPASRAVGAPGSAASTGGKSRSPSGCDSAGGRDSLARARTEAAQTRVLRGEVYGKVETEPGTRRHHEPLYLNNCLLTALRGTAAPQRNRRHEIFSIIIIIMAIFH